MTTESLWFVKLNNHFLQTMLSVDGQNILWKISKRCTGPYRNKRCPHYTSLKLEHGWICTNKLTSTKTIWDRVDCQHSEQRPKTHKRLKRTLFWTTQTAQIFKEVLIFEAVYNTKINNLFIFCQLDAWMLVEGLPCPIKKHSSPSTRITDMIFSLMNKISCISKFEHLCKAYLSWSCLAVSIIPDTIVSCIDHFSDILWMKLCDRWCFHGRSKCVSGV